MKFLLYRIISTLDSQRGLDPIADSCRSDTSFRLVVHVGAALAGRL